MKWVDAFTEGSARAVARRTARRGLLGGLGGLLVGAAALPLLPVARGAESPAPGAAGGKTDPGDPAACDYWRHCAIDGYLCSCCGGSQNQCPPGTDMSAVTWIGTCHNPADNRNYVISYNDCCGKASCGRCFCNRNEGDAPLYRSGQSNDFNWCAGNSRANLPYHCSTARIVGVAE